MKAYRRSRQLATVFGTMGLDENSATSALGWTLSQSPTLARALLKDVFGEQVPVEDLRVDLQLHEREAGGFTDIEIRAGKECHAIIEAKVGWVVPTTKQLELYAARIDTKISKRTKVVSLTAMGRAYVTLPAKVKGVEATHRSWEDIVHMARLCRSRTKLANERLWLDQLAKHLERYMQTQDILSSLVYLVPLGTDPIEEGGTYTWVDVVYKEKVPRYFHPVGGLGKYRRFPKTPQNYIGFRFHGKVQSVHFVEQVEVVVDLRKIDKRWPAGSDPVFLYTLGPPMTPAKEVKSGTDIYAPGSHFCAIDTLLSGAYASVSEAVAETNRRKALMRLEDAGEV